MKNDRMVKLAWILLVAFNAFFMSIDFPEPGFPRTHSNPSLLEAQCVY